MLRIRSRSAVCSVRQLPGDENPPLPPIFMPQRLDRTRDQPPIALRKTEGLRIAQLRLAVVAELRLAVFAHHGCAMVVGRVEFAPSAASQPV